MVAVVRGSLNIINFLETQNPLQSNMGEEIMENS